MEQLTFRERELVRRALKIACEDGLIYGRYGRAEAPAEIDRVSAEIEEIERKLNHT